MAKFPDTRISLIVRLASPDDVAAWQEFADIYAPALYQLAVQRGLQPADAEDVTQDILFGVARAIERFEPDVERARFRTWLSRIARNLIADFFAGRAKRPVSQVISDSWLQEVCSGSTLPLTGECFEQEFRAALFRLAAQKVQQRVTETTWQAFQRTVIEGAAVSAVASELQLTPGSLYVARCRVMKMLREEVQALQDAYGETLGQAASAAPPAGISQGETQ